MRMARPLFGCGVGQMWGLLDDVFASLHVTVTCLFYFANLHAWSSSTSILATKRADGLGMHHDFTCQGLISFFLTACLRPRG
jgi:hypothetical protein